MTRAELGGVALGGANCRQSFRPFSGKAECLWMYTYVVISCCVVCAVILCSLLVSGQERDPSEACSAIDTEHDIREGKVLDV